MFRFSKSRISSPCVVAACLLTASVPISATPASGLQTLGWVTLGTNGGPIPDPTGKRSEPANILLVVGKPWLVDSGDGAMERVAAAGFKSADISHIFLSHLHVDHIGGLQGVIGLRWMTGTQTPLTVYGPPGTQELVDGVIRSLQPSVRIGKDEPMSGLDPAQMVKVVIVRHGSDLTVDGIRVRAVRNSHFDEPPTHPLDNGSQSLSYRFDQGGDAITYTGDTGPSTAVSQLARGSRVLVSEVIDLEALDAVIEKNGSFADKKALLMKHFAEHHVTPRQAGKMATSAGVKQLIFTHLGIVGPTDDVAPKLIAEAREAFTGQIDVGRDLEQF